MTERTPTRSLPELVAALGTVVLLLLGIALVALDMLAEARGRTIEDAPDPPLTLTLVCGMAFVVALGWAIWFAKDRGLRDATTKIVMAVAAVLLVVTPLITVREMSSNRDLTVVSSTCEADASRNSGITNCTEAAVDAIVLIEATNGSKSWVPSNTGNLTREFSDLPSGPWKAKLTVDGPADTVTVNVIAERNGEPERIGTLRPYPDEASDQLRWSGVIPVSADISKLQVQFVVSANPAVESARLRFEVRSCEGQSVRSFDASKCTPLDATTPFIHEKTPERARTWRQLHVDREGQSFVVSNLEQRTYTLQPDYVNIEKETQSTDVLIIPAAMEQTAGNTIAAPGESSFDLTIESNTGELGYIIYVFPAGPTYALED